MLQLRKLVSATLTLTTAFILSTGGLTSAYAAQLKLSTIQLTDNISTESSTHTFNFNLNSTTLVKGIILTYSIAPSGAVTTPLNLATTSSTLASFSVAGSTPGGTNTYSNATNGTLKITNPAGFGNASTNDAVVIAASTITNNDATATGAGTECDSIASADTCYVRISTYNSDSLQDNTTLIDSSVASYTVVSSILVQAIVDPSLTFAVTGVVGTSAVTNDTFTGCTSGNSVNTTATSINFGSVRVNVPKCGQQALNVATNAGSGYAVWVKYTGAVASTDLLKGQTTSTDNIDPFTSAWGSPSLFGTPTGTTPSVNTGWLGVRTKNPGGMSPGVSGFGTDTFYAGPTVSNSALGDKVMDSSTPDLGTNATYVTVRIVTNALQQADDYRGIQVFQAVAKY
jgi:hypothetical protein